MPWKIARRERPLEYVVHWGMNMNLDYPENYDRPGPVGIHVGGLIIHGAGREGREVICSAALSHSSLEALFGMRRGERWKPGCRMKCLGATNAALIARKC